MKDLSLDYFDNFKTGRELLTHQSDDLKQNKEETRSMESRHFIENTRTRLHELLCVYNDEKNLECRPIYRHRGHNFVQFSSHQDISAYYYMKPSETKKPNHQI